MAQHSGFFESRWDETIVNPETGQLGDWDIKYYYDQFSDYFGKFFGNGVYYNPDNCLKVLSTGGMSVQVKAGWAFVNGYWYELDADTTLNVPANSTAYTRTDSVALRWSLSNREITLVYLTDTDTPVRSESIYDLIIATIQVESGVATVLGDKITDTRTDQTLCGIVRGLEADAIDTETLFAQYDAIFNEWFDSVKNQVTGDLAIRLQLEFTQLEQTTQAQVDAATALVTDYVEKDYVIAEQEFVFVNKVCTITDESVTANTLVDVYFTDATMSAAEDAVISVNSTAGSIVLTAENTPASTIRGMIRVRIRS